MPLSFRQQLAITMIDKAAIGLLLLLAGLAFNRMLEGFKSEQAKALETLKTDLARELDVGRERRAAVAEFARKMSAAYQAMEWLSWQAKHNVTGFSSKDVVAYNDDMKGLFPQLVAARVVAGSLAPDHAEALATLAGRLYSWDDELSKACVAYQKATAGSEPQKNALNAIAMLHERITTDDASFVAKMVELAGSHPSRSLR